MSDAKKQSSLMATLAVCAVFVALISCFLPFVSISFFGRYSYSAVDFIEEIIDDPEFPDVGLLISVACTILGIVFALLALKKRGMAVGTTITSTTAMILMIVAMTSDIGLGQKAIDYAAIGFYLYEIACLAAIVMSVMSKRVDSTDTGKKPTPAPKPAPKPVPPVSKPIPVKKTVCPKCKAEQEKDVAFCRFCGTPISNSKPVTPKPNPTPEPVPDPSPTPMPASKKKDGKVMCPHCGARHAVGTTNCKYCGTAITDVANVSTSKTAPVIAEDPIPLPMHKSTPTNKAGRKAICPHCGARQSEDSINCKYCGTAMK